MRWSRPGARWRWFVLLLVCGVVGNVAAATRTAWHDGWSFALGDEPSPAAWRPVRLPHDWSAELPPDEAAPVGGHGGFAQTGVGWYERRFAADEAWRGRRVEVEFEGVYMDAQAWLNDVPLGGRLNGYLPWRVDLTPHLRTDAENVLRLRVNNAEQPNARWYTGSGIYRPVWLEVSAPVRVVPDSGVSTTLELDDTRAVLALAVEVSNGSDAAMVAEVEFVVRNSAGEPVARARRAVAVGGGLSPVIPADIVVAAPLAWSPENPHLYSITATVRVAGIEVDQVSWNAGLRTVRVSAERGFELNGRTIKLYGGNLHHDHGALGAISLPRAEERKVELLKAAGFNAVRTAHNPPSTAFLAACDRLGLLVINELYDGWARKKTQQDYGRHFAEQWRGDVTTWVRRDRRHPSVVMWSTGNEMYERGNAGGRRIAAELAGRIRQLDASRPVTVGVNGLGKPEDWPKLDGLFASFDAAGYNYEITRHAEDHQRVSGRVMYASESYQREAFANWQIMRDAPYVIGDFVWSAQDYLGEAGIGRVFPPGEEPRKHWEGSHWPWRAAYCGDLDLTGWRKPVSYYRQIVWDRGARLHLAVLAPPPPEGDWQPTLWGLAPELPSWTWPGRSGESLTVRVYSRWPYVRLLRNGTVAGEARTGEHEAFKAEFAVAYEPGTLVAVGLKDGVEQERCTLHTAGPAAGLRLMADRSHLRADGQDLAFVNIEAVDANGNWHPLETRTVRVEIEGPAELAALGVGDPAAPGVFSDPARALYQGRAQAIVRTTRQSGLIRVRVSAEGLGQTWVMLESTREEPAASAGR